MQPVAQKTIAIRPADPHDRTDLTDLFRDYYGWNNAQELTAWLNHCIGTSAAHMLIATVDGKPAAFTRVAIDPDGVGVIYDLYTDPKFARHGIGTALIGAGEDWLREQHVNNVRLNVDENNQTARQLYIRQGYKQSFNQNAQGMHETKAGHALMVKTLASHQL
jgi:ribosomal protein S18 acetylase RimI-like enzyme